MPLHDSYGNGVKLMNKEKKIFTFQGESYTSYYQLEKVMNIPRRTIQYRHEVKGIPLDDVPNFIPEPPEKRFGTKFYFPNAQKDNETKNELDRVIAYPKCPSIYIGEDSEREEASKENYIKWVKNAPITLIKRELKLSEEQLRHLVRLEESKYFYATATHEIEKRVVRQQIDSINKVIKEHE